MTTAALEKSVEKTEKATTSSPGSAATATATPTRRTDRKSILVGFDLGTNKSCILTGPSGSTDIAASKIVSSVVGYVRDGIVDGIIAGNASILYGDDALRNVLHVNLVAPLDRGVIKHRDAARDLLQHIRTLADPSGTAEIRAVVGIPPTPMNRPGKTSASAPPGFSTASC